MNSVAIVKLSPMFVRLNESVLIQFILQTLHHATEFRNILTRNFPHVNNVHSYNV